MNDQQNDSGANDTRVTDFVFGELSPQETKRLEHELEQSPALQAEVDSIREAVAAVQAEFESDSRGVDEAGRRQIEVAIAGSSTEAPPIAGTFQPHAADRFSTRRALISVAIAASIVLIGVLAIPALRQPRAVTSVPPSIDEAKADSRVLRRQAVRMNELEQVVETKPTADSDFVALDAAEELPEDSRLYDSDTAIDQLAGGQETAPSAGMAQQRGQQANASGSNPSRAGLSDNLREIGEQLNLPDLPDLQLQQGAAEQMPRFGQGQAKGVAGKPQSDESILLGFDGRGGLPTPELNVTAPAADPFGRSPAAIAKDSGSKAPSSGDEFDALAQSEGKLRGTLAGDLRQKAKTSDSKRQYEVDAYGIANDTMIGQAIELDSEAESDGTVLEKLAVKVPKSERTAGLGMRDRGIASRSRDTRQQLGEDLDVEMMMGEALLGRGPDMRGDQHEPITDNPFKKVIESPLSTFSIDVDTASYAKVRMYLMQHQMLPRPDAVRIEELLNYFTYNYAPPKEADEHPFAVKVSVANCPWNAKHRLARVALKGKVIEKERPASNLVFLLDVSGSMNQPNKLPLVVEGMKMLTKQLGENDSVAIVVYAGAAGMVLDSTCGDEKETILSSLDRLRAGGSTNGGQGIQLAYETARDSFITGGTNRVILCTDGDFNVGVTGTDQLVRIAEENAKGDIFLSVLGFGMGNHNDAMMEQISNKGNGNYAFIDSKKEARKVLVEQMDGTLVTIAKDVKIQIEFNPKEVAAYRLIGYENRILAARDFNDDKKDAGEIGAGHTVTAMYELVPAGDEIDIDIPTVDESRYLKNAKLRKQADSGELLEWKLRYKASTGTKSTLIRVPVRDEGKSFSAMDADFKFAASVAAFGMLLRSSPHKGDATFAAVEEIAGDGIGEDNSGRRAEFLEMVVRAKELSGEK